MKGTKIANKLAILSIFIVMFVSGWATTLMAREYGDIYMDSKRKSMQKAKVKAVLFQHWIHVIKYKCKVCHEKIFIMKKDANDVSMRSIMDGEACGACHNGLISWASLQCDRCHSVEFEPLKKAQPTEPLKKIHPTESLKKTKPTEQ